jgi:HupE / UreJ protein
VKRARVWACALALASPAGAHMMPAHQGTLNVRESSVFGVLAVPVSAVPFVDDDRDGRASEAEVARHEGELQTSFRAGYALTNDGAAGTFDLVLPRAEHDERSEASAAGAPSVLVLSKVDFRSVPTDLRFDLTLFGAGAGDGRFTITATNSGLREVAEFTPERPSHAFFRTPAQRFRDAVFLGSRHIAEGFDHLLFVTTVVAGLSWRRVLALVTAFTVAHSLTLALAATEVVRLPGRVVEPLIAASIVLVAAGKLARRNPSPSAELAVVFACGLVHGLGFASTLVDLGLGGGSLALTLAGFNVGIEVGQGAFIVAVATAWAIVRAVFSSRGVALTPAHARTIASAAGLLGGTVWLMTRLAM